MAMLRCRRCDGPAPSTDGLAILAWGPAGGPDGVLCPACLGVARAQEVQRAG
jgi:hypothetical protein